MSSPCGRNPAASSDHWVSVGVAARALGYQPVPFRRVLARNARRAADGGIESVIDGVRGRKFGRTWRVLLSPAWTSESAPPR